ncbi:30S ribosomal protein S4 [Fervidicoccus fontis]|uniref:Small ribosomal subunit protein uS4 n=2 Tax=Fervidicoccus fontis TaxID=683846 RepID=I0A0E9_FERFK|nr:30S ribosomal protein S4 [Fervidicoccus fontis]AFH42456.1 SSU ribosomal protein S4P [Fervidicoccus fontis Kam940]MBE9391070.1 30S ribosomal protein S4 [Fervidicoccus fontis]PMB76049.1 MAG: 30S ribosomal protein S4 [Fervidicoccus fontis]HEW63664.1 30S ribosomal protein S4 [Fervidicoccus fontis]
MGDPRKLRKKWEGPGHPWDKTRLENELRLLGKFGLRNKKELWIAQTMARKIRHRARELLALPEDVRKKEEENLLKRLYSQGIVQSNAVLDDLLSINAEHILNRRLQTIVYQKGLAKTIYQARQMIVHGHIGINGRRVTSPGYLVKRSEEDLIDIISSSPFKRELEASQ